jgi:hypothetical protein
MPPLFNSTIILGDGSVTGVGTSEVDLVVVTKQEQLKKTQGTLYIDGLNLGTHTSLSVGFYMQHEVGGTWHRIVKQNASDNTLDDFPAILDSTTPANPVYQFPIGSCFGFKVTVAGVGGAGAAVRGKLMGRDN